MIKSIYDLPEVLKLLAVDDIWTNELGAVMLPIKDVALFEGGRENFLEPDDLYTSPDPNNFWVKGDVTHKAHVTLLYGLLAKAYEIQEVVDAALEGWTRPLYFEEAEIDIFDSPKPDTEPYKCIVARVNSPELIEAHQRLSFLPHINTYPEYKPHITLAYVKEEKAEHWADVLSWSKLEFFVDEAAPLDYGRNRD